MATTLATEKKDKDKEEDDDDDYIGSGMDCAVIPLKRHKGIRLVQTVDFFYPLVNDPVTMGKIALANVVSDVYAVGVTEFDKLDIIMTAPTDLTEREREIVMPMITSGFMESAKLAQCEVFIRHMTLNPWCMIGGIATAVVKKDQVIMPSKAKAGDHLVLTKPLGTQMATNAYLWLCDKTEKYQELVKHYTDEEIVASFQMAVKSMTYLNRNAALLMHKYKAHAATDVTGFGLIGHAHNLAEFQKASLKFVIERLPIVKNILGFAEKLNAATKLKLGKSVETSGGLLIAMSAEVSQDFCNDFETLTNGEQKAWIVGYVEESDKREAVLGDNPELLEVELPL